MLRFLYCRASFILTIFCGNQAGILEFDLDNYALFLRDVRDYYTASGIFLLQDDGVDRFAMQSTVVDLMKQLSNLGILSQSIGFTKIHSSRNFYLERNKQSMFVSFFNSTQHLHRFSKATHDLSMSRAFWLLIFFSQVDDNCREPEGNVFHLEFDSRMIVQCDNDERLWSWYSLHENSTQVLELARWSSENGVYDVIDKFYDSRYNMTGETIRIATTKKEPLGSKKYSKQASYFSNVLTELQACMNFRVDRVREVNEASAWPPLMEMARNQEIDVVVAPITMSKSRQEILDYSKPLLLSRNRIYFKRPGDVSVQWSAYFRAFDLTSWFLVALMLVIAASMTVVIKAIIKDSTFLRVSTHYILENFINVWGIYCQQGISDMSSAIPLRMAYFTTLVLTLVFWAIYSASITSYLTVQIPRLPFSNINGFIRDGSYTLTVMKNSSDHENLMTGRDPILSKLRPLLRRSQDLPTTFLTAFQQVCNERIGLYASEATLNDVREEVPCPIAYIETGQFECLAMVMPKRSSLVVPIDYTLRRLEDSGVMQKLKNWYFFQMNSQRETSHSQVGIWGIIPLLVIYVAGFVLAMLVFGLEHLCHSRSPIGRKNRLDSISAVFVNDFLP